MLVEIATGYATTPYLRATDRDYDVTFESHVFTARSVEGGQMKVESQNEQGGIDVKIGDTSGEIAALYQAGARFRGTRVRVWVTDVAATGGAGAFGVMSEYAVESVVFEDGAVTFHCRTSMAVFGVELPRGRFTRADYPGLPPSEFL